MLLNIEKCQEQDLECSYVWFVNTDQGLFAGIKSSMTCESSLHIFYEACSLFVSPVCALKVVPKKHAHYDFFPCIL